MSHTKAKRTLAMTFGKTLLMHGQYCGPAVDYNGLQLPNYSQDYAISGNHIHHTSPQIRNLLNQLLRAAPEPYHGYSKQEKYVIGNKSGRQQNILRLNSSRHKSAS